MCSVIWVGWLYTTNMVLFVCCHIWIHGNYTLLFSSDIAGGDVMLVTVMSLILIPSICIRKTGYVFKNFSSYAIVVALYTDHTILHRLCSLFSSHFLHQRYILVGRHFAVWESILSYVVSVHSCKDVAILCSSKTYQYRSL